MNCSYPGSIPLILGEDEISPRGFLLCVLSAGPTCPPRQTLGDRGYTDTTGKTWSRFLHLSQRPSFPQAIHVSSLGVFPAASLEYPASYKVCQASTILRQPVNTTIHTQFTNL